MLPLDLKWWKIQELPSVRLRMLKDKKFRIKTFWGLFNT